MKCKLLFKVCQSADERIEYAFKWTHSFARLWESGQPFSTGMLVRPATAEGFTGFEYSSSGGYSNGLEEPIWPTVVGGTVDDGSITWTAATLSVNSLRYRIMGAVWEAAAGMTLDDENITDLAGLQESRVWAAGGVLGQTYHHFVEVTTDQGAIVEGELRINIE